MIKEITITRLSTGEAVTMTYGDRRGYWLNDVDWGQVQGTHNSYTFLNQIGASIVNTSIGMRDITIEGFIVARESDITARCDFLNTFISPNEDYSLTYGAFKIGFRPDASIAWSRTYTENNDRGRKFLIQGTCPFPLFQPVADTEESFSSVSGLLTFPTAFGSATPMAYGLTAASYNITVNNAGGFETGVRVVAAFTASVTNPKVYNSSTAKYIGVNYTFSAGDVLEISTMPGDKYIKLISGTGESSLMGYRDPGMSWWALQPGDNVLLMTCDDVTELGGMSVLVYFTPLYQEVE